ncbi:MAG: hypothetical protein ABI036_07180 [Fibrobacteria bacterium]
MKILGVILWVGLGTACMFESENRRAPTGQERFQYVGEARFSAPGAYSVALVVDSKGTAYTAFTDASDSERVVVMRYSPSSGRWETTGGDGLSLGPVYMLDMAMDKEGIPYLAFKGCALDPSRRLRPESLNSP